MAKVIWQYRVKQECNPVSLKDFPLTHGKIPVANGKEHKMTNTISDFKLDLLNVYETK